MISEPATARCACKSAPFDPSNNSPFLLRGSISPITPKFDPSGRKTLRVCTTSTPARRHASDSRFTRASTFRPSGAESGYPSTNAFCMSTLMRAVRSGATGKSTMCSPVFRFVDPSPARAPGFPIAATDMALFNIPLRFSSITLSGLCSWLRADSMPHMYRKCGEAIPGEGFPLGC